MKNSIFLFAALALVILGSCKKGSSPIKEQKNEPAAITGTVPILNTTAITGITTTSASSGGKVSENGGATVIERGICYSNTPNPTIDNAKVEPKSVMGSGEFFCEFSGLKPSTTYYIRAFATNKVGTGYGNELSFKTSDIVPPKLPTLLLDSTSFSSQAKFDSFWNMFYPWGTDHNGAARMYRDQVAITSAGILEITAKRYETWEGYSTADPWLRIFYHSGAVHLKEKIRVTENKPKWVISGDFQVPSNKGTWPAFWITGASTWPPESDIMEFKGSGTNWQNTATGADWQHVSWQNKLTAVSNPQNWHNYKIIMEKISIENVTIEYYIDNVKTATHTANFVDKDFWLIINMQMDGASGSTDASLQTAVMKGRNIYVAAYSN